MTVTTTIFLLTMWVHRAPAPLIIEAFTTREACLAARPQYERPYAFALCQSLDLKAVAR